MKLLMIVGQADDIFIVNMAKWLKKEMDIEIDIIALNEQESKQIDGGDYYERVDVLPKRFLFDHVRFIWNISRDWDKSRQLKKILRDRHYDIIHCHYIAGLYAGADFLKKHCEKLYFTFWGGEYQKCLFFGSNRIFREKLKRVICREVDAIVNGSVISAQRWRCKNVLPKYYCASLGSASLDLLYNLIENTPKDSAKDYYDMPSEKVTVQICYSGKVIHQQLEIIKALKQHPELKERIHLVAPMTRGANKQYTDEVESFLKESGYSFTLLRDRFLTDHELAKLRYAVDVVFQFSTYDGYSRSIVECLCAGSVLFYGNWLNYEKHFNIDDFKGWGFDNIEKAVAQLNDYIDNPTQYKVVAKSNQQQGKGKYLWSNCIKDWVAVYKGEATPVEF